MRSKLKLKRIAFLIFVFLCGLASKSLLTYPTAESLFNVKGDAEPGKDTAEAAENFQNEEKQKTRQKFSESNNFVDNNGAHFFAAAYDDVFVKQFCLHKFQPVPTKPSVCIYNPKEDKYISARVAGGQIWDTTGVATVLSHLVDLQRDGKSPILLDLGANIGTFSIPALSYGVRTISVEPLPSAMKRLATSVVLNKFDPSLYSLHRSAISHKKGCAQSQEDALNKGGSEVVDVPCDGASRDDTITESTTIDDLLQSYSSMRQNVVVKMDIQGYEPYGLLGAESLFTTHNVTMLYMEWAEMKKSLNGEHKVLSTPEYRELAERTVGKLVLERGYSVYSMDTGNILKWENRKQWANNVFLIHADVKHRFSTTKTFPQPLNSI